MKLFNVDHENWEEVSTGNGTAPANALAYETETAKWVSTEAELDAINHHGRGILRYTERGLDLLRKGGYEG